MAVTRGSGSSGRSTEGASATSFFVVFRRAGPQWDTSLPLVRQSGWAAHAAFMDGLVNDGFVALGGTLAGEGRAMLVIRGESEEAVRATLARDPWHESHLRIDSVDRFMIRLDGLGLRRR